MSKEIKFTNVFGLDFFPPKPAVKEVPDWYRNTPEYIGNQGKKITEPGSTAHTIKKCIPVFDAITSGYILYTQVDIQVTKQDGLPYYTWSDQSAISFHPIEQAPLHPRRNEVPETIAATLTEVKISKADATVVDLYGTGYGAGAEVQFPLHERVVVAAEGMAFKTPSSFARGAEPNAPATSLGDRLEADVSASVDLTMRTLDLVVGYKVRNYSVIQDQQTNEEKAQGAYVGLRLGLYF